MLILLEMFRVFFPAADRIDAAASHESFNNEFKRQANQEEDEGSVTLLSRIFSLLNFNFGDEVAPLLLKNDHLDFDLALFSTYASSFK